MKVLILAGGRGTRAYPYTDYLPKPMMPVGGKPILVRVMQIFANHGFKDFVVAVGHRREVIFDYFEGRSNNGWNTQIEDTGLDADTGDRIHMCRRLLGDRFFVTYADGLCDVDLNRLVQFHDSHKGAATITNVPLRSQYGTLETDKSGQVRAFREKPVLRDHRINAGFFVMNQEVFDHWEGHSLEREVFPELLKKRMLYSYHHDGFFKSMDTFKDQQELEEMFEKKEVKWVEQKNPEIQVAAL